MHKDDVKELIDIREMSISKFGKGFFFLLKRMVLNHDQRIETLERRNYKPRIYKCTKCDFDLMFEIERDEDAVGNFLGHAVFNCPKCDESFDAKIAKNGDHYPNYNS